MNRRDCLLAALVASIWGFNFVVIDWGMDGVPPLLFVAVRFAVVLVPAVFLCPGPTVPWRTLAAVGAFMSLGQFGFLYVAMDAGMPPGLAALVLQAQVLLTVLIAAGVLREAPDAGRPWGSGSGRAAWSSWGSGAGAPCPLLALGLCLLGALSWAVGNVVSRASGATGGLALTVWSAVVVPAPLLVLSLLVDGPRDRRRARRLRLAGRGVEPLHRGSRLAGRLRHLQHPACAQRSASVVPWVLSRPSWRWRRRGSCSTRSPNGPRRAGGQ